MPQLKKFVIAVITILICNVTMAQNTIVIPSPNNDVRAEISVLLNGTVTYSIKYQDETVLEKSKLGIVMQDEDFSKGLKYAAVSNLQLVKDEYDMLTAKKSHIVYQANKKTLTVKNANGKEMDIVFQVSNDGVAFRYAFLTPSKDVKKITSETTTFHFPTDSKAWLQPKTEAQSGWEHSNPSYEAHYMMDIPTGTPAPGKNGWVYPALFHTNNAWVLITEASLGRTYCGTALQQQSPESEYSINFPEDAETIKGQPKDPQSTLPWLTPWRILAVGTLQTITESTLGTDLAFPAKKIDMSFVKPGKSSWSWIMKKDDSTIYRVQKNYVDYAADMHWQYCLLDANWDTLMGYDSVKILADYAAKKNVGILLWYNSAGNWNTVKYHPKDKLVTHESRVKEFSRLQAMGIKGIKIDFFGGDGQSFINYYQDILDDAATYHLMINFHGATLPRGWQRTYQNLISTEAVYGYEMITFNQADANLEPSHFCMQPFTRNVFDPMDITPVSLYKIPRIQRRTTNCFELATSVIFLSGIQHYVESPEGMATVQPFVKEFMKNVPAVWDEMKFIDGYPGKFAVIARRAGNTWYVAGINGDSTKPQKVVMDLSFITKQKVGRVFTDTNVPLSTDLDRCDILPNKKNNYIMQPNGGFVIVFKP